MNILLKKTMWVIVACAGILLTACNDYLSVLPKGQKIPVSLSDFEALLRDEYTNMRTDVNMALVLMNDRFVMNANLNYYPLWKANYMWDEQINRIELNNSDETAYYNTYAVISSCNLILENVEKATDATPVQQSEVAAYAKVIRSMGYFLLTNYYAPTHNEATAASAKSVPLILSASMNTPYTQVSVKEIYDFIISNVEEVLKDGTLPAKGMTILHPGKGAAYAFLARVYLQMGNYTKAMENANLALAENNQLYDWIAYYNKNRVQIENPESYVKTPSPMGYDYVENYNFRHGGTSYSSSESTVIVERAARFEPGDSRFAARWKYQKVGADEYYQTTLSGFFNCGGMTTVEVYLIKAECLARAGQLDLAMDEVNKVRVTRILPDKYTPKSANNLDEAMAVIMSVKRNELIMTLVPFIDAKRLNQEGKYPFTLSKEVDGKTYTLSANSHMWVMPFPMGAVKNSGNGTITQNVEK